MRGGWCGRSDHQALPGRADASRETIEPSSGCGTRFLPRAAEPLALRREFCRIGEGAAGKGALQVGELGEIVMGAEGHFPGVAGASTDGVAAQGFVGAGRGALADEDEAVEAGRECAAEVHAVELDVGVAEIDVVVAGDEDSDLMRLARGDGMGGLR